LSQRLHHHKISDEFEVYSGQSFSFLDNTEMKYPTLTLFLT